MREVLIIIWRCIFRFAPPHPLPPGQPRPGGDCIPTDRHPPHPVSTQPLQLGPTCPPVAQALPASHRTQTTWTVHDHFVTQKGEIFPRSPACFYIEEPARNIQRLGKTQKVPYCCIPFILPFQGSNNVEVKSEPMAMIAGHQEEVPSSVASVAVTEFITTEVQV